MAAERDPISKAVPDIPARLTHLNLSFLRDQRLKRILALKGHQLRLGLPAAGEGVLVWGDRPTAKRGQIISAKTGAALIRVEDAFLRSLFPGRTRSVFHRLMGRQDDGPLGLIIDPLGVHFEASTPSLIEHILENDPLDNSHLLARAKLAMTRMRALDLSKYNHDLPDLPLPDPGYVLVIDQTAGDASLRNLGAKAGLVFADMLASARADWPNHPILIKSHPETSAGLREGHYGAQDCDANCQLLTTALSPGALLEGAVAVYTVSSTYGFEAILRGHRPRVWGQPFYAGWGLTEDRMPPPRRQRKLTKVQLFAAAMLLAPTWYDPARDRLCQLEDVIDQLEAEVRAYREDYRGYIGAGMRLWKRRALQAFFGRHKAMRFKDPVEKATHRARVEGRDLLIWASGAPDPRPAGAMVLEDGLLRSRGLGAALTPPLSLVRDQIGIYYDPRRPSHLEDLLLSPLPEGGRDRAMRLIAQLREKGLTKYNLGSATPNFDLTALPTDRKLILVPGQVEDDASILTGAGQIRTNLDLLQATRRANPEAILLYKPHPDVEAGLRKGAIPDLAKMSLADHILEQADMAEILDRVQEVWTITSGSGFEALIRGKKVVTFGAPFYAGWGLTTDLGQIPNRRLRRADGSLQPRPDLAHLVHAALIAYPRYYDPISRRPCPVEVVVERLAQGTGTGPGPLHRIISKLQGRFASMSWLWRQ